MNLSGESLPKYDTKGTRNKREQQIDKLDLMKIKNLCFKAHHRESEKVTHVMGENICKLLM